MICPRGGKEQNPEKLGLPGARLRPGVPGAGSSRRGEGEGREASSPQRRFDLITNPNRTFLPSPWSLPALSLVESPHVSAGSQSILLPQEE